ncbi:MAG: TolC family protein [Prevotella sp.]|nr:TolC family protein [Prevotella sp.]
MRKKIIIAAMAMMLAPTIATAQKQWTLEQCLNYALENNITLKKSRIEKRSAEEDVKSSKAQLLPSLSASTNHSLGYRPWQDNGVTTVTNGQVNSKVDKTYYNGSYGVNASWTVWNGKKNINNVRQKALTEEQAELSIQETANSIQEKIAQLYVQLLYLTEAIKVNEASLETARKNEERGKEMVEVGKMSKADLAQLSAQRSSDEYSLVEAQSQLATYRLQLKQLLELTNEESFDIVVPETTNEQALGEIPSLRQVYESALATRPEIANAQLAIKNSDINLSIAKAGRMPTISMTGGLGTSTNSLSNNSFGNQLKYNFDGSVGASLSIPLFDQRQTKINVAKARLQQEQAQLDLQDKQKQLYQTIEGYWQDAVTNQQKFRTAQQTVDSEQQSFNLLQEQFSLGLKNIVELMTGKDKLLTAQQNLLQSKYMTILNMQLLRFYGGGGM